MITYKNNGEYFITLKRLYYPTAKLIYVGKGKLSVQFNKNNEVCIIAPIIEGISWAEYNPKYDMVDDYTFVSEDYQMEVKEIE